MLRASIWLYTCQMHPGNMMQGDTRHESKWPESEQAVWFWPILYPGAGRRRFAAENAEIL